MSQIHVYACVQHAPSFAACSSFLQASPKSPTDGPPLGGPGGRLTRACRASPDAAVMRRGDTKTGRSTDRAEWRVVLDTWTLSGHDCVSLSILTAHSLTDSKRAIAPKYCPARCRHAAHTPLIAAQPGTWPVRPRVSRSAQHARGTRAHIPTALARRRERQQHARERAARARSGNPNGRRGNPIRAARVRRNG
jgi:hypothetical protein